MFIHVFAYRMKILLHHRETIFWTMFFPLILATFFNMALSNLGSTEKFSPIDIAVVDNEQYRQNANLRLTLAEVSEGDDRLFNLSVVSAEEADKMLKNNKIDGYIVAERPIKLVVNKSGLNQSIIKSFADNYMHTVSATENILARDPSKIQNHISSIEDRVNYIRDVSSSGAEPNTVLAYFYSLLAMACLYGGFIGVREISDIQADISPVAARVNIAPVHKLKTFLYSSMASVTIHIAEMMILLAYLIFVLKVDFGTKTALVLLTTVIGSIAGFSFGSFISAVTKKSEGFKVAVLLSITMACCFLAGMMSQDVKYIILKNAPALLYVNPANLLTDAFFSLYYYDTYTKFLTNITILTGFIVVFCTVTYLIIRRRKYASI